MTAAELAQHYTADELLAALCARMDPANAVAAVRAVAPFLSREDKAARERRLRNERSKRSYHRQKSDGDYRQTSDGQLGDEPSKFDGEASEKGGVSDGAISTPAPNGFPLNPLPFPASPPTSAPAHVRPTVEQVTSFLNSTVNSVPPDKRAEVAQAYLDARNRTDPPWILAATLDRPARPIGADWQADCRTFCRNWQQVLERNRAREETIFAPLRSQRARAAPEPDTTPLAVDPALYRQFITSPDYPEFHVLQNQPVPATEADMRSSAREAWKTFKSRHAKPTSRVP